MEKQFILDPVLKALSFIKNIECIFLFGSSMYKSLDKCKDIDLCVISSDETIITGRIDISIKTISKRVSVYIFNEKDLYSDALDQTFASKLCIFFFHGYLALYKEEKTYLYYVLSMKSLIHHFGLELYDKPEDFYYYANIKIIKIFSNYIKSSLDFDEYELLKLQNYQLYLRSKNLFLNDQITYNHIDNQFLHSLEFTYFFRSNKLSLSLNNEQKNEQIMSIIKTNKNKIIDKYSEKDYSEIIDNLNLKIKIIKSFESQFNSNMKLKCYPPLEI